MMENLQEIGSALELKYKIESDVLLSYVGEKAWTVLTKQDRLLYFGTFHKREIRENAKCVATDPVNLRYLSLWEVIIIINSTNIVKFDPAIRKFSILCEFSKPIVQAEWNPTESYLLVIDQDMYIHGYTLTVDSDEKDYRFELANSNHLYVEVPNVLDVAWDASCTAGLIPDTGPPTISWRYNGEQFLVNYSQDATRQLKVYDSSLQPLFQSQPFTNLLSAVSFKGQINSIASCVDLTNGRYKITIFENNCLLRQGFIIEPNIGCVKQIKWHPSLAALGVHSTDGDTDYFNIYMFSNAKWYLKQQYIYKDKKFLSFEWTDLLNTDICSVNILTNKDASHYMYKPKLTIIPNNKIAVVNGNKIFITKLEEAIIPPPFSTKEITFPMIINRLYKDDVLNLYFMTGSNGMFKAYSLQGVEFHEVPVSDKVKKKVRNEMHANRLPLLAAPEINYMFHNFVIDDENRLIIDGKLVDENIKSILIVDKYLIYTKTNWRLYCVRISTDDMVSNWKSESIFSRPVEPGASIIGVTSDHEVALLVPRGNIELIECRLMTIDMIEKLLKRNDWKEAISQVRQTKLNWNVLMDLNPKRFEEHIEDFLHGAESVSLLNLILSQFTNIDCLISHYEHIVDPIILKNRNETFRPKSEIFIKLLETLIKKNPEVNIVNIVAILYRHFSLKTALRATFVIFKAEALSNAKLALFYILRYTTFKPVIRCAYSLYDKEFIRFIYSCSLYDPKLYEPELDAIDDNNEVNLRFRMNVLGNFVRTATKYLVRSNCEMERIYEFVKENNTYDIAFNSLPKDHPNYFHVGMFYAKYLTEQKRYDDAGEVYEKLGRFSEAIDEYGKGLNWEKFLEISQHVQMDKKLAKETLASIAFRLMSKSRTEEAMTIFRDHCGDYKQCLEIYCSLNMFREFITLAHKHYTPRWASATILPILTEYRTKGLAQLIECIENFTRHSNRLVVLRDKKIRAVQPSTGIGDESMDVMDNISDYDSIISIDYTMHSSGSGRSRTSAKSRRKEERKKIDCREGGRYEDIALIRQCYLIAVEIFTFKKREDNYLLEDIRGTQNLKFSVEFKKLLSQALQLVENIIPVIWNDTFLNANNISDPVIAAVIGNREHLDETYRKPPTMDDVPPHIYTEAEEQKITPNMRSGITDALENFDDFCINGSLSPEEVQNVF